MRMKLSRALSQTQPVSRATSPRFPPETPSESSAGPRTRRSVGSWVAQVSGGLCGGERIVPESGAVRGGLPDRDGGDVWGRQCGRDQAPLFTRPDLRDRDQGYLPPAERPRQAAWAGRHRAPTEGAGAAPAVRGGARLTESPSQERE